ncbi:SusC/RagA family TonB-linked outer membrane protein [Dyadobacter sp. CY323]|uniref:SusC/RagA family TonB-linked outer membrane protein n=1 Tax=Dyadobacter sp. CY323 TaxID=2907302 RepID=UPI001F28B4CE|nr:SusC/RagA family TonB-linked outer membrane protein [Dyadobacter sp. CY323]MCE6989787.1 SusC/RagA family TonB-linked outer membrane protein [Dyadobacter sp. CY323]
MHLSFKKSVAFYHRKVVRIACAFATLFFTIATSLHAHHADGQSIFNFSLDKSTLKDALNRIEKQSTYKFVYNASEVAGQGGITHTFRNQPLEKVLTELLVSRGFSFKIIGSNVLVKKTKKEVTGNDASIQSESQLLAIKGKITDQNSEPLPGVSVRIKETNQGTVSDSEGNFSISDISTDHILVFSYIGYLSQEVKAGGQSYLSVQLVADRKQLEEVVVVGYGTRARKDLVGAISKVNANEIKQIPAASADAQLQGRVAGLQVTSNNGVPGESAFVRLRGTTSINASNSPLYIIDGVFLNNESMQTINMGGTSTSALADINPNDIESMEVLKDASATSIYGARAANGVIIITTKRGKYDSGAKISLNVSEGFAKVDQGRMWKLVSGPETAEFVNESWINSGIDNPALKQTFANRPYRPVSEGGRGEPSEQGTYDRLNDVFRTARLRNYDLSLMGGTKSTKYYIGGSYTKQEATIKPVYFDRASLKINLDQNVNDKVTIGTSNSISRSFRNQLITGSTPRGIFQSALLTASNLPKFNTDGTPALWGGFDNVDVLVNNNFIKTTSLRYIGNLYVDAEILPGLKFRTSWSLDFNNYDEYQYWTDKTVLGAAPTNGSASSSVTQNSTWINEQTLSYRSRFGENHNLGILLGNTIQSNVIKNTSAQGTNFPNNSYTQISSAANQKSAQSWTKGNLASFFSRVDYSYAGKYFVELAVRADGSSRFGENKKWGYFPSAGIAWRLKEEAFLEKSNTISDLKVKASVGLSGNQNGIDDFAARGLWAGGQGYADLPGSSENPGTAPQQLGNPDLRWEKTNQIAAGVEAGFLKNRITTEVNLYRKYTTDVLLELPVPSVSGFTSLYTNAGEISNKGIEIGINSTNVEGEDFVWSTNFNIARNYNKIEKLPTPINYSYHRSIEGSPLGSFWAYKHLSVNPENGKAIYEDANKDGQITVADRQIVGQTVPKFIGGLTNNFRYKNVDLSLFFSFQQGNKVYNRNRAYGESGGTRAERLYLESARNRWQKPGDIAELPRITTVGQNYTLDPTTRVLEDGSFIRLKSLSVGYTFPRGVLQRLRVDAARVYFNATNLWLLTKYTGFDPESYITSNQNVLGDDFCTPPQPRSFQLGLSITL